MPKIKVNEEENLEKIHRGKRIKNIRENELKLSKAKLGTKIGVAGHYLGLVELGKRNLSYTSLKKLSLLTGRSTDYIIYGLDDTKIAETRELLKDYTIEDLSKVIDMIKGVIELLKK